MSSENFCILIMVGIIIFLLYITHKSNIEPFENDVSPTKPVNDLVKNIVYSNKEADVKQDLVDKMATKLVKSSMEGAAPDRSFDRESAGYKQPARKEMSQPLDIFKEPPHNVVGVPEPMAMHSTNAMPLTDNFDTTPLSGLSRDTRALLTSDQLLPDDKEINEHNMYKITTPYLDANLAANGMDKFGVDTQGSSKKFACTDLRGNVPCPKFESGPWLGSSVDPDFNIRGIYHQECNS